MFRAHRRRALRFGQAIHVGDIEAHALHALDDGSGGSGASYEAANLAAETAVRFTCSIDQHAVDDRGAANRSRRRRRGYDIRLSHGCCEDFVARRSPCLPANRGPWNGRQFDNDLVQIDGLLNADRGHGSHRQHLNRYQ